MRSKSFVGKISAAALVTAAIVITAVVVAFGAFAGENDRSSLYELSLSALTGENAVSDGDFTFAVTDSGSAEILLYSGDKSDVELPGSLSWRGSEYKVSGIADFAFSGCANIKQITLPSDLESIGEYAFEKCSSLSLINVGNSSEWKIANTAFDGCGSRIYVQGVDCNANASAAEFVAAADNACVVLCQQEVSQSDSTNWQDSAKINLSAAKYSAAVGESIKLSAEIVSDNEYAASLAPIRYEVSDIKTATVSADGVLRALAVGEVTVTAYSDSDPSVSASVNITITSAVTKISFQRSYLHIVVGGSEKLGTMLRRTPADSSESVEWSVQNNGIASVDQNGCVQGLAIGNTRVTVRTSNGKAASIMVYVHRAVNSISLKSNSAVIYTGKTFTIYPKAYPTNAYNRRVTYTSADPSIAKVNAYGRVTGVSRGTTCITVKAADGSGVYAVFTVTVKQRVTQIVPEVTQKTLYTEQSFKLNYSVSPENADDKSVTFTTSNKKVATVSQDGEITALRYGTAYITIKANDGQGAYKKVKVTVKNPTVSVGTTSKIMYLGNTWTLEPVITPEPSDAKSFLYYSSNKAVASVDTNGVVTPHKNGTAYITVKTDDSYKLQVKIKITVRTAVSNVTVSEYSKTLYVGKQFTVTPTVSPKNAYNRSVIYSTSDSSVATVTSRGVVKGVGHGVAEITVKAADGQGAKAVIKVTVNQTTLSLNASRIPMKTGRQFRLRTTLETTVSGVYVSYSSSNNAAATVDNKGVITAVSAGKAVITAKSSDGKASKTVEVNVTDSIVCYGADVSYCQGEITVDKWNQVRADGYDFAMIRAGYGRQSNQKDKFFERNYASAKQAGMEVGVYHYSYATSVENIKAEAAVMLEWLKGKQFEYPVVLDIEEPSQAKLSKKVISEMIDTYCSIMEENGYHVAIYSYALFLRDKVDSSVLDKYDVWVAHTDASSANSIYKRGCTMWQYNHKGYLNGISGNVDLNVCYVDYPSIIKAEGKNGF